MDKSTKEKLQSPEMLFQRVKDTSWTVDRLAEATNDTMEIIKTLIGNDVDKCVLTDAETKYLRDVIRDSISFENFRVNHETVVAVSAYILAKIQRATNPEGLK